MRICPDCVSPTEGSCDACGWAPRRENGVEDWLSTDDRESISTSAYLATYEQIAKDDLDASIQQEDLLKRNAEHTARVIGRLNGKVVLEIGIGQGHLFRLLAGANAERLVGVDVAIPYITGRPDTLRANAENLPWINEFDMIVATDILEHVLHPGDVLLSARRALKSRGQLVVRVPQGESLVPYARLAGCNYEHVHLRTYTRRTMRRELSDAGFVICRMVASERKAGRARDWFEHGLRRSPAHSPWLDGDNRGLVRRGLYKFTPTWIKNRPPEITVVAMKP